MMLDLTDTDLRSTQYFKDVFAEGHLAGEELGREEGREEGRRLEAMALVLRQLRRRLNPLSDGVQERIAALTLPQVEALGEALLDFAQPADLTDWLRQHG